MVQRGAGLSQLQRPTSTALYASGEETGVSQEQDPDDGHWTDEQVEEVALLHGNLEYVYCMIDSIRDARTCI